MNQNRRTFRHIISAIFYLTICALLFLVSSIINNAIPNTLPFTLYFSIIVSLLILSKIDIKISRDVKARHSIGYIFLAGATIILAALSAVDWIFLNLLSENWHYLLTVEGIFLCMIVAIFAITHLNGIEQKNYQPTSEEKMMFG